MRRLFRVAFFACGWIGLLLNLVFNPRVLQSRSGGRFGVGNRNGGHLDRRHDALNPYQARF